MQSRIVSAYLSSGSVGESTLIAPPPLTLLARAPQSPEDRKRAVAAAASRSVHPVILDEIREQNSPPSEAVQAAIDKIAAGGAAMVITGQQLGFLGGPLFTFIKAACCMRTAAELERETGIPIVPCFWMQSEDHDFEEIRAAALPKSDGGIALLELPADLPGVGDSVGSIVIPPEVRQDLLNRLENILGDRARRDVLGDLSAAFEHGDTIAALFRGVMQTLSSRQGLLIFDPSALRVKHHLRPFLRRCIEEHAHIEAVLENRVNEMSAHGYEIQIPIKSKSPLLFLSHQGRRVRISAQEDGSYELPGTEGITSSIRPYELWRMLDETPERFSSSALIRPLMQDALFPTAAYVSGPAELHYWVETTPLYEYFSIPQPLVILRPSFTLLEPWCRRSLEKSGLDIGDLARELPELLAKRFHSSTLNPEALFKTLDSDIGSSLDSLAAIFNEVEPRALHEALETTRSAITHNIQRLKGRYVKALAVKEESFVAQYERLKNFIIPGGEAQERVIAGAYFALVYGDTFFRSLLENTQPFEWRAPQVINIG